MSAFAPQLDEKRTSVTLSLHEHTPYQRSSRFKLLIERDLCGEPLRNFRIKF
jgi:hypothetical protein